MPKIKINDHLFGRAQKAAQLAGYSSVDEFICHIIEKEIAQLEPQSSETDEQVKQRLRGLGYIE